MTIHNSATPLTMTQIQNEFGGSNPISLSEYWAGSGLVPSGTPGIPGPGQISMSQFFGASNYPIPLPVRVLIIGGGGGGGQRYGWDNASQNGGGGAGGWIDASFNLYKGSYGIGIGGGGGSRGSGGDTTAFGYTAYGGGYGGSSDAGSGGSGGSGGGASPGGSGGSSIGGQGNSGYYGGGGAGGAGDVWNGGPGATWINGGQYAAGGGANIGVGGAGGGGGGYYTDAYYTTEYDGYGVPHSVYHPAVFVNPYNGGNPGTNYGCGGQGGSDHNSGYSLGGSGYSGLVIVSYTWSFQLISGGSVSNSGSTWYNVCTGSTALTF